MKEPTAFSKMNEEISMAAKMTFNGEGEKKQVMPKNGTNRNFLGR